MRSVHTQRSTHPYGSVSPCCLSPVGTTLGLFFASGFKSASTFLAPFAPPAFTGFFATMAPLIPACPGCPGAVPCRCPQSTHTIFWTSRRHPRHGPRAPLRRQPSRGTRCRPCGRWLRRRSLARRSVSPNHVRHPTGHPFSLPCSPPRLAATQLGLNTRPECLCLGRDLHPSGCVRCWAHDRGRPARASRSPSAKGA